METTLIVITNILLMVQQVNLILDHRNRWIFAAMVALLLKGKRAHLYELGKALPCKGKVESRVHKLRRWLSNPHITPQHFLPLFLNVIAPFLAQRTKVTLILDRTEWHRLGVHINLLICAVLFHNRSFPLYWAVLAHGGCSSLADQQAVLTPGVTALAAHPLLALHGTCVLADREFCSPKLAKWLTRQHLSFCIRVKKSYRVARSDIPSTPIRPFLSHCQKGTSYFFEHVQITASCTITANLFLYWRNDCAEPLALMTDLTDTDVLPATYHDRMFIETLHRDLKSGGYEIERGKLTDATRLTNLLIPMAFAYMLTVLQGHLDDLSITPLPVHKPRLSLFTKARNLFQDVLDRQPATIVAHFFRHLFEFLLNLITQPQVSNWTSLLRHFAHKQRIFLQ